MPAPFEVIIMSVVKVQVFVAPSQVPTVEQSPPSLEFKVIPEVVTTPSVDVSEIPSKSFNVFPVAVLPVKIEA